MKAVLLAGGYATRLWPLTKDTPKALLEVGEKTLLEHILHQLEQVQKIKQIYITTNEKFEPDFRKFLKEWKGRQKIELIIEKGFSEEKKKGSVGALLHMHEKGLLDERMLIMAADNLFGSKIVEVLNELAESKENSFVLVNIERREDAKHYGVCELDENSCVIALEEKPEQPKSTLVSTGCYALNKAVLDQLPTYCEGEHGVDRMGDFIRWLIKKTELKGIVFKGKWFDIGTHDQLERAREEHEA